jgi:hypothetical protein
MEQPTAIAADQAPTARKRPLGRRRADLPFDQYILQKLNWIDRLNEQQERQRIQTYVTLTRRHRGDLLGFFASDGSGTWIPCENRALKRVNIVAPVVRANTKNWMDANIELEVTAASSDPEVTGGADTAQSILDMLCERSWDEHWEEMIAGLAQLTGVYFIYSRFNKSLGPKLKVPRMARKDVSLPGEYPEQPIESPGMNVIDGYDEQPGGDVESVLYTSYEMKVDERNTKGGKLCKGRFLRNNYLVYRNELEELRPWAKLQGSAEWSEGLKYQRALEVSAQTGHSLWADSEEGGDRDEDLLDYRRYWLDRKFLMGYVSPADYSHGDASLGYSFDLQAGQTLDDVYPEGFEGLYVERNGDELLMFDNEDFRKHWTAGHWQMDPTTFWGKAQEDLLDLQEMRIEMVNIFFQAGMSMSMPPLIIDGMLLDGDDFVNDPGAIVYTKKGYDRSQPISSYVHQMFPQGPGPEMFNFYQLLVNSTDESSGVAPVSVGQGDPSNKTATGQQLLTQRSVGLIVPSQKNKAAAKKDWGYQQLELVQKYWTTGRYVPIKTKYGEEWKEADVEAFRKADIRNDFVIRYVEGSDVPQSPEEKAQKLFTLLQSQIIENTLIPVQLRQMAIRAVGVDYDLENFESEIRLCNARLRRILKVIELFEQNGMAWLIDPQGMPAVDQYGQPMIEPQAVLMILNAPGCETIPESDDHTIHTEFWSDQLKAEAAKDDADPLKIAVFRARIKEQALAGATMQAAGNQLALMAQAPMMQAQGQAQQAEGDHEEQGKQQDHQREQQAAESQASRDEATKDNDAARQVAVHNATNAPTGPPTVTAPALKG